MPEEILLSEPCSTSMLEFYDYLYGYASQVAWQDFWGMMDRLFTSQTLLECYAPNVIEQSLLGASRLT